MLSRIVCNSVSTRMGTRGSGISRQLKLGPPRATILASASSSLCSRALPVSGSQSGLALYSFNRMAASDLGRPYPSMRVIVTAQSLSWPCSPSILGSIILILALAASMTECRSVVVAGGQTRAPHTAVVSSCDWQYWAANDCNRSSGTGFQIFGWNNILLARCGLPWSGSSSPLRAIVPGTFAILSGSSKCLSHYCEFK